MTPTSQFRIVVTDYEAEGQQPPRPGGALVPVARRRCTRTSWAARCGSTATRAASSSTTARSTWSSSSSPRPASSPRRRPVREGQRPERTVYALTDAGRRELRDWLRELVEEPQHEYPHFVAALSLIAALPPDEVVELLGRRLERLAARARRDPRADRRHGRPAASTRCSSSRRSTGSRCSTPRPRSSRASSPASPTPRPAGARCGQPFHSDKETPMTSARTALVIGGGIAGPATAMALQKAGIDADRLRGAPHRRRAGRRVPHARPRTASTRCACSAPTGRRSPRASPRRPSRCAARPASASARRAPAGRCPTARPATRSGAPTSTAALHEQALARGIRIEHGKRLVGRTRTAPACAPCSPTAPRRRPTC